MESINLPLIESNDRQIDLVGVAPGKDTALRVGAEPCADAGMVITIVTQDRYEHPSLARLFQSAAVNSDPLAHKRIFKYAIDKVGVVFIEARVRTRTFVFRAFEIIR